MPLCSDHDVVTRFSALCLELHSYMYRSKVNVLGLVMFKSGSLSSHIALSDNVERAEAQRGSGWPQSKTQDVRVHAVCTK